MRKKNRAILCLLLLLYPAAVFGETFSFSGEQMQTVLAEGKERTILTGNAVVQSEDNTIKADTIELYGEDFRYISCRGRVSIVNREREVELSGQELFYNRKDKVLRLNGNVIMIDRKNELVAKGGFMESWEEREETIIQIGVRILKEDLVCRSEFARYLREEEQLELAGIPLVNWKGDEYRAMKIFVDLDEDRIRLEGDIRGKVESEAGAEGGS